MLDLRLRYQGGGTFQTATRLDFDLAEREYAAGDFVRSQQSRPRSVRQNNTFHAMIEVAWENQRGGPTLPTWRHLKSHVLIEIEHCDVHRFKPGSLTPEVAAALRKQFDMVDFAQDRVTGDILMRFARSISFKSVTSDEMSDIFDKAAAYICLRIVPGITPDALVRMARSRAGATPKDRNAD